MSALARRQQPDGLLEPEQFSSDIKTPVHGLHAQAVAWEGLRAIASAWRNAGHPGYAERAERVAARLGAGAPAGGARARSGGSPTARSSCR